MGTRAVAGEYVITYPYGDFLTCQGIDGVCTGEYAADALVDHALALGLVLYGGYVFTDFGAAFGGRYFLHILAFGGEHHECDAETRYRRGL